MIPTTTPVTNLNTVSASPLPEATSPVVKPVAAPKEYALRLTIDKDRDSGQWIYKALDPITGEVVKQFPREELLNLRRQATYVPGSVIKTDI